MRAVITVLGKDMVGILAKVSAKCAEVDVDVYKRQLHPNYDFL